MKGPGTVAAEWDFSGSPDRGARYMGKDGFPGCACQCGCRRLRPLYSLKPFYRAISRS